MVFRRKLGQELKKVFARIRLGLGLNARKSQTKQHIFENHYHTENFYRPHIKRVFIGSF